MAGMGKTQMTVDEPGNLQLQHSRKFGIFQGDNWQVFSDGGAEIVSGVPFVNVYDVDGDAHLAKRKETGSWIFGTQRQSSTGPHVTAGKTIDDVPREDDESVGETQARVYATSKAWHQATPTLFTN